jgi:hypothetical protein
MLRRGLSDHRAVELRTLFGHADQEELRGRREEVAFPHPARANGIVVLARAAGMLPQNINHKEPLFNGAAADCE